MNSHVEYDSRETTYLHLERRDPRSRRCQTQPTMGRQNSRRETCSKPGPAHRICGGWQNRVLGSAHLAVAQVDAMPIDHGNSQSPICTKLGYKSENPYTTFGLSIASSRRDFTFPNTFWASTPNPPGPIPSIMRSKVPLGSSTSSTTNPVDLKLSA